MAPHSVVVFFGVVEKVRRGFAGLATGSSVVDERPPQEPGKPEVRFYEQIYLRNNEPVGQWSDSVRVTLQP